MKIVVALSFRDKITSEIFEPEHFDDVVFFLYGYWALAETIDLMYCVKHGIRLRIYAVDDNGRKVVKNPWLPGVTVPQILIDGISSLEDLSEAYKDGIGCIIAAMEERDEVRTEEQFSVGEASRGEVQ